MKLNPEIKAKWLTLIRRCNDQQSFISLRKGDCYSLSGLLCRIHSIETNTTWHFNDFGNCYLGCSATLPEEVKKWLGLKKYTIYLKYNNKKVSIGKLQNEKVPFKTLYKLIEEQL